MDSTPGFRGAVVVLLLSWALPLLAIVQNQLNPGVGTALGVAYGFFIGCGIHLVLLIVWAAMRRFRLPRAHLISGLVSLAVMIILAVISNGGALSRTSG